MDDPSRYLIWKYLPYEDIVRLCMADRRFNTICSDPETWKFLLVRDFNIQMRGSIHKLRNRYQLERERQRVRNELVSYMETKVPQVHPMDIRLLTMVEVLFPESHTVLQMSQIAEPDEDTRVQLSYDYLVKLIAQEIMQDSNMMNLSMDEIIPMIYMKGLNYRQKDALRALKRGEITTDGDLFKYGLDRNVNLSLYELRYTNIVKMYPGEYQKSTITITPEASKLLND